MCEYMDGEEAARVVEGEAVSETWSLFRRLKRLGLKTTVGDLQLILTGPLLVCMKK